MLARAGPLRPEPAISDVNIEMHSEERATLLSASQSPKNADADNTGYEEKEELGHGGFGVVHRVVEISTGRVMARKLVLLPPKREDNARTVSKVQQELQVLRACNCENVVACYGSRSDHYSLWIFMELMHMSVDDMIIRVGLVPEKHLAWIARNLLNAVRYLKSEHRVLHRDLKPANILLNAAGEVKLCDLGVCATLSLLKSTASTACVGTRTYMPPECLNGKGSNLLSEVWSIGIIMHEAAVGRYPIPELTKTEVAIVQKKIELISRGEWKQLSEVQQKWGGPPSANQRNSFT
ncbi:STE/STE7/MEK1 protein kinase [Aphelenchoides avenae]|nr:STE/STE7/MEK1 protein kinase [Aphelenchus avenae]